ncbi:hypothetical protein C8T65DRAFT_635294 [Cerioporus squamosus]|nr:hypothetical protein C8T65DRAFT_635294 [Cerioporus squamosus]
MMRMIRCGLMRTAALSYIVRLGCIGFAGVESLDTTRSMERRKSIRNRRVYWTAVSAMYDASQNLMIHAVLTTEGYRRLRGSQT